MLTARCVGRTFRPGVVVPVCVFVIVRSAFSTVVVREQRSIRGIDAACR